MASISNLFIDQGSDYSNIITVGSSTGTVLNLTNYTVASQLRKSYGSSTYYTFTATVYDAVTGKVRLQLPAATSSTIPAGRYLYDIKLSDNHDAANNTIRILEGMVTVSAQVTR